MNRMKLTVLILVVFFILTDFIMAKKSVMKLIKGGEFLMGKKADSVSYMNVYSPVHKVFISSFYMDIHEVTNQKYYEFCKKTGHRLPEFWGIDQYKSSLKYPDYPVIGVSKKDAVKYAKFVGKRLPTEAEWEFAARGGLIDKDFSNGNDFKSCIDLKVVLEKGKRHPYPVLSGNPNKFGLYGMSGNAREWVQDIYEKYYYKHSDQKNPKGPKKGRLSVVRGGGWKSGTSCKKVFIRNALRGSWVDIAVGFRCVRDVKEMK